MLLLLSPGQVPGDAARLWDAGKRRDAVDRMTAALKETPKNRELREALVECEMQIGRFRSALAHMESLGDTFNGTRGTAHYLLGEYEDALRYLDARDPAQVLYRHEALRALARVAEADAALDDAERVLGKKNVEVLVRRGQQKVRDGEHAAAIPFFEKALTLDPIQSEALFGLGRARVRTGEKGEGLKLLEKHRALTPLLDRLDFARRNLDLDLSHAPNHAALADVERELAAFDSAALDRAVAGYVRAAELATKEQRVPIALRHARLLAEDRADVDGAVGILQAAWRGGKDARLAVRAGDLFLQAKRAPEALAEYERARVLRPQDRAIAARIERAREAIETAGNGKQD